MAIVDQLHGVFSARVRRVEFPQPAAQVGLTRLTKPPSMVLEHLGASRPVTITPALSQQRKPGNEL